MLSRLRMTGVCAALLALVPSAATADAGDGLSAGNLNLSPGITANSAFDSNVFRQSPEEAGPVLGSSLQLAPFLEISTIEPGTTDFGFDGRAAWQQYLSGERSTVAAQSGLTADVGAFVNFNKQGAVSFQLEDRLQRTNEPPPVPSEFSYNRMSNRLGGTLGVHPGGKVFQHYLSYDWNIHLHDELPDLNRQIHDFTLKNYWRFLPKTAAVLSASYALYRYSTTERIGGIYSNTNSNPLRITGGLTGLITNRVSLRLIAGWGWGFYESGSSFTGILFDTQLAYMFSGTGNRLYLGYERNFQDSSIANFATYHRPYAGYEHLILNQRLKLNVEADGMIRDYFGSPSGDFPVPGDTLSIQEDLQDLIVRVSVGAEFNIYKWWSVFARYHFAANFTDDVVTSTIPANDAVREYQRHLVTLGTTFRY